MLLLGFLLGLVRLGEASIHDYYNGVFSPRSNSFIFHGGSEGLYASSEVNITAPASDGNSFVQLGETQQNWNYIATLPILLLFLCLYQLPGLAMRAWIISAFWSVLSAVLLGVICILWVPSQNPTRYAYSEDTNDDFDDEGPLTESGVRGIGDPLSKLERKERNNIDHTFVSAGDHEEDKRE